MSKGKSKHMTKAMSKEERIRIYNLLALAITVLITLSAVLYICNAASSRALDWIANFFMSTAVGVAVSAFFLYVSNARIRKYKLQTSLRYLDIYYHHMYFSIPDIISNSEFKRNNGYCAFLNYRDDDAVDWDIIEANRPELFEKCRHYIGAATELRKVVERINGIEELTDDEIKEYLSDNYLIKDDYLNEFVVSALVLCDEIKEMLKKDLS